MSSFVERVIGAAKLDAHIYEEVEHDRTAMAQAMTVVALSAVAAGIGSLHGGFRGLVAVSVAALVGWFLWGWLTYLIGTKLLPEADTKADPGQLLRTIGFSSAPGVLRIFGFVPLLGGRDLFRRQRLDAGGHGRRRSPGPRLLEHQPGPRGLCHRVAGVYRLRHAHSRGLRGGRGLKDTPPTSRAAPEPGRSKRRPPRQISGCNPAHIHYIYSME